MQATGLDRVDDAADQRRFTISVQRASPRIRFLLPSPSRLVDTEMFTGGAIVRRTSGPSWRLFNACHQAWEIWNRSLVLRPDLFLGLVVVNQATSPQYTPIQPDS